MTEMEDDQNGKGPKWKTTKNKRKEGGMKGHLGELVM